MPKRIAYAVTEREEHTGSIVFATSRKIATAIGAALHADGDDREVSVSRAKWADRFGRADAVPAGIMVEHGWRFECAGCGRTISDELPYEWENEVAADEPLKGQQLLYARWTPADVVGFQDGTIHCRPSCRARDFKERRRMRLVAERVTAALRRSLLRRIPDAAIVHDGRDRPHVYATRGRHGRIVIEQASISFTFPDQKHGPATMRADTSGDGGSRRRGPPEFFCATGDLDAFRRYLDRAAAPSA